MSKLAVMGRALVHRNFRLYVFGQSVSFVGTWMQQIGLAWLIYELTDSPLLLGAVSFVAQIPTFFVAPLGGVLTDRWDRRKTLYVTQSSAMLVSIALVALTLSSWIQVWHIFVLAALQGIVNAFDMPNRQAFLAEMVPNRTDLPNAIALNSTVVNGSRMVGPFLAGLVIAVGGPTVCFALNAASFSATIGAALLMRDLPGRKIVPGLSVGRGLIEGFQYAFGFRPIRTILLMIALVSMMGMPLSTLLPVYAEDILQGGPSLFGFLAGASGLGALGSAIYLTSRESVLGLGSKIVRATAALGVLMILFAWSQWTAVSLALLVGTGFCMMFQMAANATLLQTIVDEDKRGRVMSLYTTAFMGTAPIGSLLAGVIAENFRAPVAITIGGVACLIGAAFLYRGLPAIREQVMPIYQRLGIVPLPVAVGAETAAEFNTAPQRAS
ncbi:MAG TPA: MFS transporter [Pirellulaceae bacterium]|jgi:MFS family permease|nr:MFS transporter [Pirellulaceae bacterium]